MKTAHPFRSRLGGESILNIEAKLENGLIPRNINKKRRDALPSTQSIEDVVRQQQFLLFASILTLTKTVVNIIKTRNLVNSKQNVFILWFANALAVRLNLTRMVITVYMTLLCLYYFVVMKINNIFILIFNLSLFLFYVSEAV